MSSCNDMETNNMQTIRDYDDEKHGPKSPENETYLNEALGHLISNSVEIRDVSVKSQEYYVLIVELKDASNLCHLGNLDANCRVWISYEFLGMVVQSDQFICSKTKTHFPIKRNQFFWNGTCPSDIHIYICAQERVLGATKVGIQSIFFGDSGTQVQLGKKEIISKVTPIEPDENGSRLLSHQKPHIQLIIECNVFDHNDTSLSYTNREDPSKINRFDPLLQILPKPVMEPLTCKVEEHIYEVAKHLSDAKLEIERKQKEWNTFVHREEKKFRDHLREKEEKVRNYLNLIIQQNQEEHSRTLELCRVEYRKLEARLKKSLREVEAKEREIARQNEEKEAMLTKKLTEFDVKEKMLREEAQHLIDMEAVKLQAALQKIAILEKDVGTANQLLEVEKKKFAESEEKKTKEELSRLRCRVIELESQLNREIAEKRVLALDQDRYRMAAHKLAKLIRHERGINKLKEERILADDNSGMKRTEKLREIKSKLVELLSSNENEDS